MKIVLSLAWILIVTQTLSCQKSNGPKQDRTSDRAPAFVEPGPQPTPVFPQPQVEQRQGICHKADQDICMIEFEIFKQTNEYRVSNGLSPLKLGKKLSYASRIWSISQASRGRIGHAGFSRQRMASVETEFGTRSGVRMSAENVAMTGFARGQAAATAREFTQMWIRSRGHRKNILSNTSVIGVGVSRNSSNRYYATQIFGSEGSDSAFNQQEINAADLSAPMRGQTSQFDQ